MRGSEKEDMTPDQLVEKWKHVLDEAAHIFTWTEPATLAYLAELANQSELAVELGTYFGASAFVMLTANPDLHLWSADSFEVAGTRHLCENITLKKFIQQGRCELITGDSRVASRMLQHVSGQIDLLFVDDGHQEFQVKTDIDCFYPLLRMGRPMTGHDFDINPFNDVARGVISSGHKYSLPVPRLWEITKS